MHTGYNSLGEELVGLTCLSGLVPTDCTCVKLKQFVNVVSPSFDFADAVAMRAQDGSLGTVKSAGHLWSSRGASKNTKNLVHSQSRCPRRVHVHRMLGANASRRRFVCTHVTASTMHECVQSAVRLVVTIARSPRARAAGQNRAQVGPVNSKVK